MKNLAITLAMIAGADVAIAQEWKIDPAHTNINFSAKYLLISEVSGEFKKFEGEVTAAKDDWSDLKASITIDVNSISTDNAMRDKHLKSDDFFNAEKYPTITFTSTGFRKTDKNNYILTGKLTIREVTKTIELPVVYGGMVKDPYGNVKAGFKISGKIDRQEFGLKYRDAAATGEAVVSDEIKISIDAVLIRK